MMDKGLTAHDVAEIMNVRVEHVYALCRSDLIPHYYAGRLIRFDKAKVEAWIDQGGARTRPASVCGQGNPPLGASI